MKTKFKRAAYILRTCTADMSAYGGFKWPTSGIVDAPDWEPTEKCGNGLHGLLNGEGDGTLLDWRPGAVWLVAEIEAGWVDLDGKVKFPRARVVHCGDQLSATRFLADAGAKGAIVGGTATAGHNGTATAGDRGTATAGDWGTAMAGDNGTATAGHNGTATAGHSGTATAGHSGTAMAGCSGTATAGHSGTAMAGCGGTATAGCSGTIVICYWDDEATRFRVAVGYVGGDGIEPNAPYRVENGKLVKA